MVKLANRIAVALVALVSGCVSVQQYPDSWSAPVLAKEGACPSIAGSYDNKGEGRYPQYPPNLAYQLLEHRAKWREADRVDIELSDSQKLVIRTTTSGRLLDDITIRMEKGLLSCEAGFLVLNKREFVNREGALGSKTSTLRIATSGESLVIKEEVSEIGMLFLIPGASSYTNWSRYARLK